MGTNRKLLLGSAISVFVRLVGGLSAFLLSLFLARYLGATESGVFFFALSLVMVLSVSARIGTDLTVLRFTSIQFGNGDVVGTLDTLRRCLILAGISSTFVAVALYFVSGTIETYTELSSNLSETLRAMSPGLIGLSMLSLIAMGLQGMRKIVFSVFVLNIALNAFVILGVAVRNAASPVTVGYIFSIGTMLTAALGWYLLPAATSRVEPEVDSNERLEASNLEIGNQQILNSCIPLWGVDVLSQLSRWSAQLISGFWIASNELSQLATAQRTALLIGFILAAVNTVLAPKFASFFHSGQSDQLARLSKKSCQLLALISLPLFLAMMIFPSQIMGLFGSDFRGGAGALQILAIAQFVNVCTGSVGYLLSMTGHERDLRRATLIGSVVAIVVSLILIPRLGLIGAAMATAIASILQNLLMTVSVKQRLGFWLVSP
ncbi:polysaccharide biosynthesis C-terminal domain-containing protein [Rubripirellula amarantea]|nr:polysaccharide biosynthesis C-terminal domain-containing protein [Rubripirellula amarantea]